LLFSGRDARLSTLRRRGSPALGERLSACRRRGSPDDGEPLSRAWRKALASDESAARGRCFPGAPGGPPIALPLDPPPAGREGEPHSLLPLRGRRVGAEGVARLGRPSFGRQVPHVAELTCGAYGGDPVAKARPRVALPLDLPPAGREGEACTPNHARTAASPLPHAGGGGAVCILLDEDLAATERGEVLATRAPVGRRGRRPGRSGADRAAEALEDRRPADQTPEAHREGGCRTRART